MQGHFSLLARLGALAAVAATLVATQPAEAKSVVEKLHVDYVSPYVDLVTVLPGERFPLRVTDGKGHEVNARWTASGGELYQGDGLAVWEAPLAAGAHRLTAVATVAGKKVTRSLSLVVTVPTGRVQNGKLNGYPIGNYPKGFGRGPSMVANRGVRKAYDVPLGFVELNAKTLDVPVSTHYKLRDFAGKDEAVGGKKYIFVEPKLIEKLERLTSKLQASGYSCPKIQLMSAYRSPWLNRAIGNETTLSRHTYGDAADMIVGDYNRDGRADKADATVLWNAVNDLDRTTTLIGGAGWYNPNGAHGYFIHTDTRGVAARW